MTSTHQIIDLAGRVICVTYFDRPLADLGAPGAWVCSKIAEAFDVDDDEVSIIEPPEDDLYGDDYVAVSGTPVARYVVRYSTPAETAQHAFADAAE